ncbi:nuclease-related domain-containing protein [Cryobacterium sp. PH29-G1]|uniref:nuclease-related domain-containing protein n=1 Tax=Cryobacterium sp. PH29-G1 TaxID=3046211 RepID=UPI0024BA5980|nr:nuclease-related domain-containing protein [Cryobacterium sp. PH29-G1]MDJ0348156.1 nuclease-related domain-containing protein [Cryobacterium sp. PH29-G1]
MPARVREPADVLTPVPPAAPTAPGRFAGQSVIEELLRQHEDGPQQSRLARALGASPLDANELGWLRAAQAEIVVGDILARLPDGYSVYHSLPIRNTAFWVDHLVVGPGGIFAINSKTHWDRDLAGSLRSIPIGDHAMPYLRDARFESAQITALLAAGMPEASVVQPMIVLVNPHKILLARKPDNVTVIDSTRLRRWLVARPAVFTALQQAALTAVVDDPAIWRTAGQPLTPAHLHARFTALEQRVAAARTRRTTFTVLAAAAAATVLAVVASPLLISAVEYFAAH